MWSARKEQLDHGRVLKFFVELDGAPVSFGEVLRRWQSDAGFHAFFSVLLADVPFSAFRWETPPVTAASTQQAFQFVLLDEPSLARRPDPHAFATQFAATGDDMVVSFPNLGGDAVLVVPCPISEPAAYGHLAAFLRQAPEPQKHALWSLVGKVMSENIGAAPIWLSTAGAGVSWLHVRLDQRPKYYGYAPYRNG